MSSPQTADRRRCVGYTQIGLHGWIRSNNDAAQMTVFRFYYIGTIFGIVQCRRNEWCTRENDEKKAAESSFEKCVGMFGTAAAAANDIICGHRFWLTGFFLSRIISIGQTGNVRCNHFT